MDQPHLVDGLDRTTRGLGGVTRCWRLDRMATVCHPDSGKVTASFARVAKHYGVQVAICPPRSGNRKGVVEKINHSAAQRWWRTLADEPAAPQLTSTVAIKPPSGREVASSPHEGSRAATSPSRLERSTPTTTRASEPMNLTTPPRRWQTALMNSRP